MRTYFSHPGWEELSIFGWDPPLTTWFAQLWRNGTEHEDEPQIWIAGINPIVPTIEDLAGHIAVAADLDADHLLDELAAEADAVGYTARVRWALANRAHAELERQASNGEHLASLSVRWAPRYDPHASPPDLDLVLHLLAPGQLMFTAVDSDGFVASRTGELHEAVEHALAFARNEGRAYVVASDGTSARLDACGVSTRTPDEQWIHAFANGPLNGHPGSLDKGSRGIDGGLGF